MNPEHKSEPIQESSVEAHENLLRERMLSIQLEYAFKLSNGEIPFVDGTQNTGDLKSAIIDYTMVERQIREAYTERTGKYAYTETDGEYTAEYDDLVNKILSETLNEYGQNKDFNALASRVNEIIKNNIDLLPAGEVKNHEFPDRENLGLIGYSVMPGAKGLEKYGISRSDQCVSIHFDALYKHKDEQGRGLNVLSLKDPLLKSFEQLAKEIKEKHNDAKAIIATSWLLDPKTPLSKVIKFHIVSSWNQHGLTRANSFWGQFIDEDGQIKQAEVDKFLKTGKPKYRATVGYIPIDEFLEEYGK